MPTILEEFEDSPPLLQSQAEAYSESTTSVRAALPPLTSTVEAAAFLEPSVIATILRADAKVLAAAFLSIGVIISDVDYEAKAKAYATGFFRLNDEANVFFGETLSAVEAYAAMGVRLRAIVTFDARVKAAAYIGFEHVKAAGYDLTVNVELIPEEDTSRGVYQEYVGKFTVDGEELLFTRAKVTKASNGVEKSLELTLAKPSDRSKIAIDKSYKFELNTIDADGNDSWETLIDSELTNRNFTVAWADNAPQDTLAMSSRMNVGRALRSIPIAGLTIYDNSVLTLDETEFKKLKDTSGRVFNRVVIPFGGLTLHDLFDEVLIERCELNSWQSNIPNYRVKRLDVDKTQNYLQSLGGVMGSFEPLLYIDDDNNVKIIDTTDVLPEGFPEPRAVYCRNYTVYSEDVEYNKLDGYFVSWVPSDYDVNTYWLPDTIYTPEDLSDTVSVETTEVWKEYRTYENPDVIIRRVLYSEEKKTFDDGVQIDEEYTLWEFDAMDRPTGYTTTLWKRTPEIAADTIVEDSLILQKVQEIFYDIFYGPHKYAPSKTIQLRTIKRVRGYSTTDAVNQQLGQNYKKEFVAAYEDGNLNTDMEVEYRFITTEIEDTIPLPNGQIQVKSYIVDHLANIIRPGSISEAKSGDISVNNLGKQSAETVIHADENNPVYDGRFEDFSLGEIPPEIGLPLVRRKLALQNSGMQKAQLDVIGRRRDIDVGSLVLAKYRDESNLGSFLIEGTSIVMENAGKQDQTVFTLLDAIKVR
jgi:hypothetical protein